MEGAFAAARVCPRPGCTVRLAPTTRCPDRPDYWVRRPTVGEGWWYTFTAPVAPREVAGRVCYACPTCGQTFRLVEALEGVAGADPPAVGMQPA
jgi:hypothetical protein